MPIMCSECDCVVEAGRRIEACKSEADCCCRDVPIEEGVVASRPGRASGL